jgi:hypothetical protein
MSGRFTKEAERDLKLAADLTGLGGIVYKDGMMLNAILILTAMAMCMHMMCMPTAVGALESSRKA